MNEMSNMAAPKAHLSSFSSYFPGNHSRKINKVVCSILNGISLMIYYIFYDFFECQKRQKRIFLFLLFWEITVGK